MGSGLYPKPMPRYVFWFWITFAVGLVLFLCGWTFKIYADNQEAGETEEMDAKKKT